eukprot:98545-Pelagomonas_calceolata.AAC.1
MAGQGGPSDRCFFRHWLGHMRSPRTARWVDEALEQQALAQQGGWVKHLSSKVGVWATLGHSKPLSSQQGADDNGPYVKPLRSYKDAQEKR